MSVDFPRAWEIARAVGFDRHHERCSYRVCRGGTLCDCQVLTEHPEYRDDILQGSGGKVFPEGLQIKAITLHQPWASLIAAGLKHYETRGWPTHYRGPLAIHAAQRRVREDVLDWIRQTIDPICAIRIPPAAEMPLGAVVAIAHLGSTSLTQQLQPGRTERACGDWSPGRFAWNLSRVQVLPMPAPAKGRQGLWDWEVPAELVDLVQKVLG